MENNLSLNKDNTFVISLLERNDRRKKIAKILNSNKIDFQFFNAIKNTNGTIGCLLSHVEIIKTAKNKKLPYVWIMEDDCFFTRTFEIPKLPEKWEMLFFGGAINKIYDEYYYHWKKVSNWYAHCYIVKECLYDKIIDYSEKLINIKAIDEIYCEDIHPYINSYCIFPTLASQDENYSDIEKQNLDRNQKIMNFDELMNKKNPNPKWLGAIYCINLTEREDKYKYMQEVSMKEKIKVDFMRVSKHSDPRRGCLESHLEVLREAKERDLPNVLILEDDIEFLKSIRDIEIPEEWDMLYLGGNHIEVNEEITNNWFKIKSWSTYGYIVNKDFYDKLITGLSTTKKEIDRYYIENIHPNYRVYMINPKIVVPNLQFNYSDIEGKEMDYSFLTELIYLKDDAENKEVKVEEKVNEVDLNLEYEKFPKISIITPTIGRPNMFRLALYNFKSSTYPKDKMEWIILDEGDTPIKSMLPNDSRIKYHYISKEDREFLFKSFVSKIKSETVGKNNKRKKERTSHKKFINLLKPHKYDSQDFNKNRIPIALKRNMAVRYASNDIIVHMDDDDFYPPDSFKLRVLTLLNNKSKGIECVSCSSIASFNIVRMISMVNVPPFDMSYDKRVSEATMCYYRKFWEECKFENKEICSEGEHFLKKRINKVMDMDWNGIIISLIHSKNFTSRSEMTEEPNGWHFGPIDDKLFLFLTSLDERTA